MAEPRATVLDSEPAVGQTLQITGRRWKIAGHSTYANDEGFAVDEWECARADGHETAYLLREHDRTIRWFFTRPIPLPAVTLTDGKALGGVAASLTEPPGALRFRGSTYLHAETTDGTYADEAGQSTRKITWDYWDAAHQRNLAIERWPDGRLDAYHGEAIDPASITAVPGKIGDGMSAASRVTTIALVIICVFLMLVDTPLETGFTATLSAALVLAFGASLRRAGRLAWGAAGAAVALGFIFETYPPLTTGVGMLGAFAATILLAAWGTRQRVGPARVWLTTALAIAAPTFVVGLATYYRFAPTPRSFGQYVLAVGPSLIVTVLACAVAWTVTRMDPTA